MFRSKKTKTEPTPIGDIKDWRDAGHEIESLGVQLDNARTALAKAKTKWAKDFWKVTANRLYTKWSLMIQLKDTGLRQQGPSSIYSGIDYYWYEKSEEIRMIGFTWFEGLYENAGLGHRLDESWAKSKEQKLEKARLGQA
jgi:hypothetical protein